MARIIKVYRLGDRGMEVEEVNPEKAERLIEEAYAQGRLVVDKKEGVVIHKIGTEVEELLLIDEIGGG